MLYKFSTNSLDDKGIREQVFIDGQPVSCTGYTLIHNAGEVPSLLLELPVNPKLKDEMVLVQVGNKEEIARLMDKTEFEKFCEVWKEVHNEYI